MTHSMRMRGFSLLEVMVALIIISIGMLGIAKMQGLALSNTTASRSRALAAIEASSLAAAMQANRTYWSNISSAPGTITIATSAGAATFSSTNAAMGTAITGASGSTCSSMTHVSCYCVSGSSPPCTPASNALGLAASDLYDFGWSLASFLPSSSSTVSCYEADTPVDCTIHIQWSENTVAPNSKQTGSTVTVSFELNVVP